MDMAKVAAEVCHGNDRPVGYLLLAMTSELVFCTLEWRIGRESEGRMSYNPFSSGLSHLLLYRIIRYEQYFAYKAY